jgi:SET and MYND domain-containing protein
MSRLHLNTFKVDAVFPMDWDNPYAAAAAMMQADSSSGSALYLLASLYNHSCEPNVNVMFPNNDAVAVFTAARHIAAGEQLHITYTDVEQEADVRQEYLAFAYGFNCQCVRCQEEGGAGSKTG